MRDYKNRRSTSDRRNRKESLLTEALSEAIKKITPAVKQFLNDIAESEKRIADAKERKARAEIKAAQSLSDIVESINSQDLSALNLKHPDKKPPKPMKEHHKKVSKIIKTMRNKGATFSEIASYLDKENIPTFSGRGKWHAQTVHRFYEDKIFE